MKKYVIQTSKKVTILQWMEAFELSDVQDALEELSETDTTPVTLLIIANCIDFDAPLNELHRMVDLFERYKKYFSNRIAYVVSKDEPYHMGRTVRAGFWDAGIDFIPFRDVKEAREWINESPP